MTFSKTDPVPLGEPTDEHTSCLPMQTDTVRVPLGRGRNLHTDDVYVRLPVQCDTCRFAQRGKGSRVE